jgi:hypothetical protein
VPASLLAPKGLRAKEGLIQIIKITTEKENERMNEAQKELEKLELDRRNPAISSRFQSPQCNNVDRP